MRWPNWKSASRPPKPKSTHRGHRQQGDLFSSPHQVVLGNPHGNVTMVEFFDYNCGYCKRALPDMLTLMKTNPNLKFVLKEFPVLGEGSVEAARVAVAARMQDSSGKKYLEFHQKLLGGRGPADKTRALAVAKDVGFDMTRIEKDRQRRGQEDDRREPQACRCARRQRHAELRGRRPGRGRRRRHRCAARKAQGRAEITGRRA